MKEEIMKVRREERWKREKREKNEILRE